MIVTPATKIVNRVKLSAPKCTHAFVASTGYGGVWVGITFGHDVQAPCLRHLGRTCILRSPNTSRCSLEMTRKSCFNISFAFLLLKPRLPMFMLVSLAMYLITATGHARLWVGDTFGHDVRRPAAVGGNTSDSGRRNRSARDYEKVSERARRGPFSLWCDSANFTTVYRLMALCLCPIHHNSSRHITATTAH